MFQKYLIINDIYLAICSDFCGLDEISTVSTIMVDYDIVPIVWGKRSNPSRCLCAAFVFECRPKPLE
ncbi:MAG: hypothetical protein GF315_00700 [candidate division Zixibacteria bacterium]|nr:hypothetical protein [candidate division Zixibacteria bacterium]